MTILVIAPFYPMSDRAAGELRFFILLKLLAAKYDVTFYPYRLEEQRELYGPVETQRYADALSQLGVRLWGGDLAGIVKSERFDVVLFEFYIAAERHLENVKAWQPKAYTIVDSVDVHFKRLQSKASLTGDASDVQIASEMKIAEMAVYRNADLVWAATDSDREALLNEEPNLQIGVIPTIHSLPSDASGGKVSRDRHQLVFIGSFAHEPNVDAIVYFCREIFPAIRNSVPNAKLKIVGNAPSNEIARLASDAIEVTGYVPDTTPFLESSAISVAPLRFGAGMKGKIGEAMCHGLPVVTTSVGVDGFGLTPGENVLVADSAEEFAAAVVRLMRDPALAQRLGASGRRFIDANYSQAAVAKNLYFCFDTLKANPVKKLPVHVLLKIRSADYLRRHLLWRFQRA